MFSRLDVDQRVVDDDIAVQTVEASDVDAWEASMPYGLFSRMIRVDFERCEQKDLVARRMAAPAHLDNLLQIDRSAWQ